MESMASVSPWPMVTVTVPPLISKVGVLILDFWPALMASSVAAMVMVPSLTWIYVPSMASLAVRSIVPLSTRRTVVA